MELIYQNFDGLEISFQCAISASILKTLEQAKIYSQQNKTQTFCELGINKLPVMVYETGARGGYNYQFSTGHDGEIWLIADRDNAELWNVRVRVRSLCLALRGYEKTKEKIMGILLHDLRAKGSKDNEYLPKERISRIDYCLDFLISEEFSPDCRNFVCHGRTKKILMGNTFYNQASTGQKVETITIGKMPNRQVTIYNKTKEISVRLKTYWWKIWGLEKSKIQGVIWRVEIRAGKKELNKWSLRTFADFENKVGDVITHILSEYKYTVPNHDKNQTRWPLADIWKQALENPAGHPKCSTYGHLKVLHLNSRN